jgi:hypothetical protein
LALAQAKKFQLALTSEEASSLLENISEEFRHRNSSLISRISGIASADDGLGKGRGLDDKMDSQSKGHKGIAKVLSAIFPGNKISQECSVELVVKGRKTSCSFDIVDWSLRLIVEIQGAHHDKFVPHFHNGNYKNFVGQQNRDEAKILWARENGWTVLEVKDTEARKIGSMDLEEAKQILSRLIVDAKNSF